MPVLGGSMREDSMVECAYEKYVEVIEKYKGNLISGSYALAEVPYIYHALAGVLRGGVPHFVTLHKRFSMVGHYPDGVVEKDRYYIDAAEVA